MAEPGWRLTLEPVRGAAWTGVPAIQRLRSALKRLLRDHGLRAVAVEQLNHDGPDPRGSRPYPSEAPDPSEAPR